MSTITKSGRLVRVCSLADLEAKGVIVAHPADRPVAVYLSDGKAMAVDNRCPHMGFPLHKGTVKDGILTCHWHQARFDLCSGCTFDLFADDIPAYDAVIEGDDVFVDPQPRQPEDSAYHLRRLRKGLEQNIGLIQNKSLRGLLESGATLKDMLREVVDYGSVHHDAWGTGMTMLTIVGNLFDYLSDETTYFALCRATQQLAGNCAGATPRRLRHELETDEHDLDTLERWFAQWIVSRHRDGAERTLMTAIKRGASTADLTRITASAATQRVFADTGHNFDFWNKAFELLDHIGHDRAADVFPLLMAGTAGARGGEENAHWHHPVEIIEPLRAAEATLADVLAQQRDGGWAGDDAFIDVLLGDDPLAVIDAVTAALSAGAPPVRLAQCVAYAGGMRLARFAISNDVRDWFDCQHTFNFCNATYRAVGRCDAPGVTRAIYHAALAVYHDRFLNVPPAKLPGERGTLDNLPTDADGLRQALLDSLDQRAEVDAAARITARYLRLGHAVEPLIDTLTYATVREDIDFHSMQVLEAGVRQYFAWQAVDRADRGEHILVGVARNLAAHCPTQRAGLQTATVALRLHRGDRIYEEDE